MICAKFVPMVDLTADEGDTDLGFEDGILLHHFKSPAYIGIIKRFNLYHVNNSSQLGAWVPSCDHVRLLTVIKILTFCLHC